MKEFRVKIVLLIMLFIGIILILYIRKMQLSESEHKISEAYTMIDDKAKEYCRQNNIDRITQFSQYYSEYYARNCILEDIKIEIEEDRYEVVVSFVYEPILYEIKDEMYKTVAYYALQISSFYPEVKKFEFVVMDHRDKKEVMRLEINEKALKKLYMTFFEEYNAEVIGQETSYSRVFSKIEETEISLNWHEHHDAEIMP